MTAPRGWDAVLALYGDPHPLIRDDGTISPFWEARMVGVKMPAPLPLGWNKAVFARSARVHQVIAGEVESVFEALRKENLWARLRTYDGGYTWRVQRGSSSKLSLHSFGAALDFDANSNKMKTKGDINREVVAVFEAFGWTWGGRFGRRDPMHFQFAAGV